MPAPPAGAPILQGTHARPARRPPTLRPQQWIEEQKEFAGLERFKRNVWVQIQLDGTVRSSDLGSPPWARMVADLPPLDSFKTRVTDGIGPSL